jgi:hypothetical protein
LLSDIAGYLSGSLVSEVPAIVLLSMSAWAFVRAWNNQSLLYAGISGCLAFMLYVVRIESIWLIATFIVVFVWLFIARRPGMQVWWRGLLTTGLTAALPFLIYSWLLFPLTDPRLFLPFSESAAALHSGGTPARIGKELIAANGLLWLGTVLALPLIKTNKAFLFGSIWLALLLVPAGFAVANNNSTQVRMFTTLAPSLFVLSTLGWSNIFSDVTQGKSMVKLTLALFMCAFLVMVSQPASYSIVRTLPGMWRLQFIRQYLAPMQFERIDYNLPELSRIRDFLDKFKQPFIVVASDGLQAADHIMIIEYLDLACSKGDWQSQPNKSCNENVDSTSLQVYLADMSAEDIHFVESLPKNIHVLLLRTSKEQGWFRTFSCCGEINEIFKTDHYSLAELVRKH